MKTDIDNLLNEFLKPDADMDYISDVELEEVEDLDYEDDEDESVGSM